METKPKILVVDDDPNILTMVSALLTRAGYDVRTATNTIGAGYLLSDYEPDLVVLDIMLPGSLSGDQACDTLRQLRPKVKIVFYSGIDDAKLAELAEVHRADAVVAKGTRPSELIETVDRLMGRAPS